MAAASAYMAASTSFSMLNWNKRNNNRWQQQQHRGKITFTVSAQQAEVEAQVETEQGEEKRKPEQEPTPMKPPRPVEPQTNVKSKNMLREYGGQWLSCTTRHVRIYAAYIDPETCEFDQTQMDKLTLILDPTDEFVWTDETCT